MKSVLLVSLTKDVRKIDTVYPNMSLRSPSHLGALLQLISQPRSGAWYITTTGFSPVYGPKGLVEVDNE